jgi:hypothetical protein
MASGGWRLVAAEMENEGRGGQCVEQSYDVVHLVSDEFVQ